MVRRAKNLSSIGEDCDGDSNCFTKKCDPATKKCAKRDGTVPAPKKGRTKKVVFPPDNTFHPPESVPDSVSAKTDKCMVYDDVVLRDHQKGVVKHINKEGAKGLVVVHSMGSGKSLTAAAAAECYVKRTGRGVVILVPTSVVGQFAKELVRVGLKDYIDSGLIVISSHQKWLKAFRDEKTRLNIDPRVPGMLIVDEAHKFSSRVSFDNKSNKWKGRMAKALVDVANTADKVLLMTGTPVTNSKHDLMNYIAAIDGLKVPAVYRELSKVGAIDSRIPCNFSYFKAPQKGFPVVREHTIDMVMPNDYYKRYFVVEQEIVSEMRDMGINFGKKHQFNDDSDTKAFYNGIRRASNTVYRDGGGPKLDWVMKHIEDNFSANKRWKVMIYSSWIDAGLVIIQDEIKKRGIEYREVNGTRTATDRTKAVKDFNSGQVRVLFVSSAGAEGLDLKGTRSLIIFEPYWNRPKMEQIIGRGARYLSHAALPEDEQKLDVFHLILKKPAKLASGDGIIHSADEIVTNIVERKLSVTMKLMENIQNGSIENPMNRC